MCLTITRPDLMLSVKFLSRLMSSPKRSHWEARKRVLRYVIGTIDHGIHYKKNIEVIGEEILMITKVYFWVCI